MTDHDDRQDADDRLDEEETLTSAPEKDDADASEADWGLSTPKSGIGKEIKIGVSILTLVCCLFGYVVWQKMSDESAVIEDDRKQVSDATSPETNPSGEGNPDSNPPIQSAPPLQMVGAGANELGGVAPEDQADPFQEEQFQEPIEEDFDDPASTHVNGWEADPINPTGSPEQSFENPEETQNNQAEDLFGGNPLDEQNPYARDQAETETSTGIVATTANDDFSDLGDADFGDIPGDNAAASVLEDSPEATQEFDEFSPIERDVAQTRSDTFPEEDRTDQFEQNHLTEQQYQATTEVADNDVLGGEQRFTENPSAEQTYGGIQHSSQASSQTIVRRVPETESAEAEPLDPRSGGNGSRFSGYRTADTYQTPADRQFPDDSSLGSERDRHAAEDDFASEGLNDPEEMRSLQKDVRSNESEFSRGFGESPNVAGDRNRNFDNQRDSNIVTDGIDQERFTGYRAGDRYVVEANDSFWSIARQTYGSPLYFQALAKHNQQTISDPLAMKPGIEIETPSAEELQRLYPELLGGVKQATQTTQLREEGYQTSEFEPVDRFGSDRYQPVQTEQSGFFYSADRQPQYRVESNDTLGAIARKYLGRSSRWEEIHRLNRDRLANPNHLKIGTVLRLPADATEPRVVESPRRSRYRP